MSQLDPQAAAPVPPAGKKRLRKSLGAPSNAEKIRGLLAVWFVGLLVVLQFRAPTGPTQLVVAAQTVAISVVAFYFGLHATTTASQRRRQMKGQ